MTEPSTRTLAAALYELSSAAGTAGLEPKEAVPIRRPSSMQHTVADVGAPLPLRCSDNWS